MVDHDLKGGPAGPSESTGWKTANLEEVTGEPPPEYSDWNHASLHVCVLCAHRVPLERTGEGCRSGTRVTNGSGSPCGCWEQNLGSLEE